MARKSNTQHLSLVHGGAVSALKTDDQQATINGLMDLLGSAERGEIVGLSWAAVSREREITHGALGLMKRNIPLAHLAASRLVDVLLWFK